MTQGEKMFWGGFAALVVALLAVGVFWRVTHPVASTSDFTPTTASAITGEDWTIGASNPKVTLIEYGDFQCPACGAYEPIIEQLRADYGSQMQFVFRNFPLAQHSNARISAQAAEAAGLQGKYWEMHDLLYSKQNEWSNTATDKVVATNFIGYAQSLGLDTAKFQTDIESTAVKNKIQKDMDSANAAQVNHTPTFFVNLTQIENPDSPAAFKAVIDAALAAAAGN